MDINSVTGIFVLLVILTWMKSASGVTAEMHIYKGSNISLFDMDLLDGIACGTYGTDTYRSPLLSITRTDNCPKEVWMCFGLCTAPIFFTRLTVNSPKDNLKVWIEDPPMTPTGHVFSTGGDFDFMLNMSSTMTRAAIYNPHDDVERPRFFALRLSIDAEPFQMSNSKFEEAEVLVIRYVYGDAECNIPSEPATYYNTCSEALLVQRNTNILATTRPIAADITSSKGLITTSSAEPITEDRTSSIDVHSYTSTASAALSHWAAWADTIKESPTVTEADLMTDTTTNALSNTPTEPTTDTVTGHVNNSTANVLNNSTKERLSNSTEEQHNNTTLEPQTITANELQMETTQPLTYSTIEHRAHTRGMSTTPEFATTSVDDKSGIIGKTTGTTQSPAVSSTNRTQKCPCSCEYYAKVMYWRNLTAQNISIEQQLLELQPIMEATKKELTVNKSELSSFRNTKISAPDDRSSSKGIGVISAVFLCAAIGSLVFCDLLSLNKHFSYAKQTCCRK